MSKIICDVCGTAYPETASQCPICGCAKPAGARTVSNDKNKAGGSAARSYTYVKGGRFSKSNVRKRNRAGSTESYRNKKGDVPSGGESSSNRGLSIAVVVLLLAILAVVFYIGYHFFWEAPGSGSESTGETSFDATTEPMDRKIPCVNLILEDAVVELDGEGQSWLLNVTAEPADTTDAITYVSSDESVAKVTSNGRVTAEGSGQAVIFITCGDVEKECRVICSFEPDSTDDPTDPTEPSDKPTDPSDTPTDPPATSGDYTIHVFYGSSPYYDKQTQTVEAMIGVGETFPLNIRDSGGKYVDVTWKPSNGCCTVSGNTVTGVASGSVTLTTTYDGITFTCRVVVK